MHVNIQLHMVVSTYYSVMNVKTQTTWSGAWLRVQGTPKNPSNSLARKRNSFTSYSQNLGGVFRGSIYDQIDQTHRFDSVKNPSNFSTPSGGREHLAAA